MFEGMAKTPPKKPTAKSAKRIGYPVNVWIDEVLGKEVDALIERSSPKFSKTAFIEAAIREYVRNHKSK